MKSSTEAANIAGLIASSAHDAKNSLGVVLERLDELSDQYGDDEGLCRRVGELRREVGRVNSTLVRMLTLYKIGAERYALDLQKQSVREVIEETLLGYHPAFSARGILLEIDCPAELIACFDFNLVSGVVADALHNACRFARTRVRVGAFAQAQGVVIQIEDDGLGLDGFVAALRVPGEATEQRQPRERGFVTGNTGLGMSFANLVAQLHCRGELCGRAELDNDSRYGGARWAIYLP
jgi:signal transduction histidine kinase